MCALEAVVLGEGTLVITGDVQGDISTLGEYLDGLMGCCLHFIDDSQHYLSPLWSKYVCKYVC